MKILFTGLPYFGKQLVAELNAFDPSNRYVFCNTYYSKWDQLKFLWHLLGAKKIVSFNGVTSNSRALNWTLRFKKPLVMQWHGSDVLTAKENKASGKFTRKYVDPAVSYTDAPWLKTELSEIAINAEMLAFKHVEVTKKNTPFSSADVLTYIANGKEEFYGIQHVLQLADEFPNLVFHVVGSDGKSIAPKSNVHYYGWISEREFQEKLNTYAIFLRLTKHDGYSLSVMRAIENGNYVFWNNPHPAVEFVKDIRTLNDQLKHRISEVTKSGLSRNKEGIDWASKNLDRKKILQNYIETILK